MRNLKKILALVLALIMSLSLMATAGAASFPDVDESNPYATAIDVLDQLKVFQGFEDGTFKPTDTLNRAQAAVLVYRIATGDVEGKYVDNYTYMAQSKFTDLDGYTWAKGYINYCQNAKIVVGTSATTFNPGDKVTGYQLMVMLLRTLGYGAAGEFADPKGWELETAKIAEREGILKNVTGGDFGAPAPRQMVAEILFQGLLTETVTYSALTSGGYTKTGETLGKKNLGLEKIEGIVVANEYANLDAGKTLGSGKTLLRTETKDYTLNVTSGLDEIGEYRYTYVVPAAGSRNSDLTCTGLFGDEANKTWEDTDGKKVTDSGIDTDSKTEKFVNFNDVESTPVKTVIRIGYVADISKSESYDEADEREDLLKKNGGFLFKDKDEDGKYSSGDIRMWYDAKSEDFTADKEYDADKNPLPLDTNTTNYDNYAKTINKGATVSSTDQSFIDAIFLKASKLDKTDDPTLVVDGEVYVGTQNITDYSDDHTQAEFEEKCYDKVTEKVDVKENDKGNWLKVIDNNNDGVAEYVFKVVYTMAQIAKVKDSTVTLDVKNEDLVDTVKNWSKIGHKDSTLNAVTGQSVNCNYDDPAAGDVVYYAVIDNKVQAYKAEVVSAVKIDKVNRNTLTATVDGTDYVQSEVHQHIMDSAYSEGVRNLVVNKVTYDLFLDRGGYLAAFVKSELGGNLVLLTDGWFMAQRGGNEYAAKVYNRETKEQDDTTITDGGDLFIDDSTSKNNSWGLLKVFGAQNNGIGFGELNADAGGIQKVKTMIGALDEDGNLLPVDSDSVYTRTTKRMVSVNDNKIVGEKYEKGVAYTTSRNADTAYNLYEDWDDKDSTSVKTACEIRALTDTVYYYVYPVGNKLAVREYVGYDNVPDLKADAIIEDVYAVGTVHGRDSSYHDDWYFTADVVVVELSQWKTTDNIVFVYDFPVVANQTKAVYDDIQLIDPTGEDKTVTVDLSQSDGFGKEYDPTDTKFEYFNNGFLPGLYWMYETAEPDVYRIEALDHDEINDTRFVVGEVATTNGTAAKAYTEIGLWGWDNTTHNLAVEDSSAGHAVRYLTEDSKYYTLSYDWTRDYRDWASDLKESDYETTLSETADEIAKKDFSKEYNLTRDHMSGSTYYNDNKVLMLTKSNGDIIWAVSLEMLWTDGDGYEHATNLAYLTWLRSLPEYEAPETVALTVNAADNNKYDVKWNGGSTTIDKSTPVDLPVGDAENFVFTIAPQAGNSIGDVSLGDNATWLMVAKDVNKDGSLWRCELYRRNSEPVTQSIDAQVDVTVEVEVTVTSQAVVKAVLDKYNSETATEDEKAAALEELKKFTNNEAAKEIVKGVTADEEAAEKVAAAKKVLTDAANAYDKDQTSVTAKKALYEAAIAYAKADEEGAATDATYAAVLEIADKELDDFAAAAEKTDTFADLKAAYEALPSAEAKALVLADDEDGSGAAAIKEAEDAVKANKKVYDAAEALVKAAAAPVNKDVYDAAYAAYIKVVNAEGDKTAQAGAELIAALTGEDNDGDATKENVFGTGTISLVEAVAMNKKLHPAAAQIKSIAVAEGKEADAKYDAEAKLLLLLKADADLSTAAADGTAILKLIKVTVNDATTEAATAEKVAASSTETEYVFKITAEAKDEGGKAATETITVRKQTEADETAAAKAAANKKVAADKKAITDALAKGLAITAADCSKANIAKEVKAAIEKLATNKSATATVTAPSTWNAPAEAQGSEAQNTFTVSVALALENADNDSIAETAVVVTVARGEAKVSE